MTKLLLKLIFVVLIFCQFCVNQKLTKIKINQGLILGKQILMENGISFFAFLGIPYALPPIGSLRFKLPVPVLGWPGTMDALEYKPPCPQFDASGQLLGSEDCLHLNVYTKNLNYNLEQLNKSALLPVMIYVHAESFENGDSALYGPEKLLKRDIILITFNYRLGILGFLSTQDEHAQGNFGLYDQILAFKWIKSNIIYFGGNPNMITVFGQGAGASSILYHLMSKNFDNYFHKAILQSGSNICEWAIERNPLLYAQSIANKLGCLGRSSENNFTVNKFVNKYSENIHSINQQRNNDLRKNKIFFSNNPHRYPTSIQDKLREVILLKGVYRNKRSSNNISSINDPIYNFQPSSNVKINFQNKPSVYLNNKNNNQNLVECLRRSSLKSILNVQATGKIFGEFPQRTAPTIETFGYEKIISEDPLIALRKSNFKKIPIIIGLNSDETAYFTFILNKQNLRNQSYFQNVIVSNFLKATTKFKKDHNQILPKIMNQYFNYINWNNNSQIKSQFIKMSTDAAYGSCIHQTAQLYSRYGGLVYFYSFEYKGSNSMLDLLINLQSDDKNHDLIEKNYIKSDLNYLNQGVCHGDELFSLFNLKTGNLKQFTNLDRLVEARLITLWTEFANSNFDFLNQNHLSNDTSSMTGLINRNNKKNLFYGSKIFWPPFGLNGQYIKISNRLEIFEKYRFKSLFFWQDLKLHYLNESELVLINSIDKQTFQSNTSLYKYATLAYVMIGISICLMLMVTLLLTLLWFTKRSRTFKTSIPGVCNSNPSLY